MKYNDISKEPYLKIGSKSVEDVLKVVKKLSKKLEQLEPRTDKLHNEYTRVF